MAAFLTAFVVASLVTFSFTSIAQAQTPDKTAATWLGEAQTATADGRYVDAETAIASGLALEPKNLGLLRLRGEVRLSPTRFCRCPRRLQSLP